MELSHDVDPTLANRRLAVADWIQTAVRPAAKVLENIERSANPIDEEIIEEATHFEVREYQLDAWGTLWDARQSGKNYSR